MKYITCLLIHNLKNYNKLAFNSALCTKKRPLPTNFHLLCNSLFNITLLNSIYNSDDTILHTLPQTLM